MNELAILSLLLSLIFSEITGIVPGGIIVPLYFALYLDDPVKVISTIGSAALSICVIRLLSRYTILYGRRKFALFIVIGLLQKMLFTYLYFGSSPLAHNLSMTIGYLVPGILGNTMDKQGSFKTLGALGVVAFMTKLVQILLT